MASQLRTSVSGQRIQVCLGSNVRQRELAISAFPRLNPDLGQLVAPRVRKDAEHFRERVGEQRREHEDVEGSAGWPPDAAAVLWKRMAARLEDHIIERIIGCAGDTDEHLPFECAAEADLD